MTKNKVPQNEAVSTINVTQPKPTTYDTSGVRLKPLRCKQAQAYADKEVNRIYEAISSGLESWYHRRMRQWKQIIDMHLRSITAVEGETFEVEDDDPPF